MNLCFLKPEKLVIDFKTELEKMNPMEFQGLQCSLESPIVSLIKSLLI